MKPNDSQPSGILNASNLDNLSANMSVDHLMKGVNATGDSITANPEIIVKVEADNIGSRARSAITTTTQSNIDTKTPDHQKSNKGGEHSR